MEQTDAPKYLAFQVEEDDRNLRLDRFLAVRLPATSRSRIKQLIKDGRAARDGRTIIEPNERVKPGETYRIALPPPEDPTPRGEAIPLDIVFEDEQLLVIDKPAGLVVHPAAGNRTGTLVNALIAHCGESLSGIAGLCRPGIVHRLDKETSGLMVVAKTDRAHRALAAQFADHGRTGPLERKYAALVWGAPRPATGRIHAPLGRRADNRQKIGVLREGGREAITHYAVDEVYGDSGGGEPVASRVTCALETGRTHQIRVHMAHIGHPLLGDPVYGAGFRTKQSLLNDEARTALAALERQALHAQILGFTHPVTGKMMRFEAAPPEDFQHVVKYLTSH